MSTRFARLRIAVLLVILVCVLAWALGKRLHARRHLDWRSSVAVTVLVLSEGPIDEDLLRGLEGAFGRMEDQLRSERERHTGDAMRPLRFSMGTASIDSPPPLPRVDAGLLGRARDAWRLERYLDEVAERADDAPAGADVTVYLVAEPDDGARQHFVEGFGVQLGDYGLVRVELNDDMLDQAAVAAAHEVFHCLGASDKYDAGGHAIEPEGLVDPSRSPLYPQARAALMVGELPLGPGLGRLPESIAEVGIAPATAAEIGWLRQ